MNKDDRMELRRRRLERLGRVDSSVSRVSAAQKSAVEASNASTVVQHISQPQSSTPKKKCGSSRSKG